MKKTLTFVLILILALLPVSALAADEDSFTEEKDGLYLDENGEVDHGFPETVEKDGKIYVLSSVKLESNGDAEPEIHQEKIAELKEKDAKYPEETVTVDGVTYKLIPDSVKEIKREEKRETTVTDSMERDVTAGEDALEEMEVTVTDEETGEEVTAAIPYKESELLRTEWVADFSTEMVFSGYDADVFLFGDTIIQRNDAVPLTPDQYGIVMSYLSMNPASERITGAVWRGDPFMDGDTLKRVAVLSGETLHEIDTDYYEGAVELSSITYIAYEAEYEEFGETLEKRSSVKATATYTFSKMAETETEKESETEKMTEPEVVIPQKGFLQSTAGRITLIGVAILAVAGAVMLFLFLKKKKKDEDKPAES
ncbi:MAG: hypothetical protein IKS18_00690 [Lachnospiraceae bacterium]|nr:hypothetical protein [Lachnospiraceae bacterium]